METIKEYGKISNFKINPAKSEILSINILKKDRGALQEDFKFTWKKELKYLGIKLAISIESLYNGIK